MTLALDLGTNLGFAERTNAGVWYGTVKLDDSCHGSRFRSFRQWLSDRTTPGVVWFERPIGRSLAGAAVNFGLRAVLLEWAFSRSIPCHDVAPNTLKKRATGNGRCGKLTMQSAAVAWLEERGELRGVPSFDEADAVCLLAYALEQREERLPMAG